jgi:hypothetical protein
MHKKEGAPSLNYCDIRFTDVRALNEDGEAQFHGIACHPCTRWVDSRIELCATNPTWVVLGREFIHSVLIIGNLTNLTLAMALVDGSVIRGTDGPAENHDPTLRPPADSHCIIRCMHDARAEARVYGENGLTATTYDRHRVRGSMGPNLGDTDAVLAMKSGNWCYLRLQTPNASRTARFASDDTVAGYALTIMREDTSAYTSPSSMAA